MVGASDYSCDKYSSLCRKKQPVVPVVKVSTTGALQIPAAHVSTDTIARPGLSVDLREVNRMDTNKRETAENMVGVQDTPHILKESIIDPAVPLPLPASQAMIHSDTEKYGTDTATASSAASSSDIAEIEEVDGSSLYFDSELQSRTSFSAKSIIKESGHIDHEKMLSWSLPPVNTSNLRK